jgi:type VI secretion system secreted protein VgrG
MEIAKEYNVEAKKIQIEGKDEIVLKSGSATITLKKNGDIVIDGKKIDVKGSGDVKIKGSKSSVQ